MNFANLKLPLIALALAITTISCSKKQSGSDLLDMGVNGNGIILETETQSCVDVASITIPPTASVAAPAMTFSAFSLTWKSTSQQLFIGTLQFTIKSPKIAGGSQQISLSSAEVEALLGVPGAVVPVVAAGSTSQTYNSRDGSKLQSAAGTALKACGLAVGPITLVDPKGQSGKQFLAQVTIQLIGTATNVSTGEVTVVLKTVNTNATFY